MRSKTILKIAAFIIAFGFSTAFASLFVPQTEVMSFAIFNDHNSKRYFQNNSAAAVKISALIYQDKRNGYESDRKVYESSEDITSPYTSASFPAYAEAVEKYIDDSSRMKTRGLPSDFQTAWREHMKAWRDYSNFLNNMKETSNQEFSSEEEFNDANDFYNNEINRTWFRVLQIGESYGADVYE